MLRDATATRDITTSISTLAIACNKFIDDTIAKIIDERATEGHSQAKVELDQKDFGYQFTYEEISQMLIDKLGNYRYRVYFNSNNKSIYIEW